MIESQSSRLRKALLDGRTKELLAHRRRVNTLSWSADGDFLASGSHDKTARIWVIEPVKGQKDVELTGHTETVEQVCWNPLSSEELATTSSDKSVRLWDRRSGKNSKMVITSGKNLSLGWSPDGKYLVVGNRDDVVTVYDYNTAKVVASKKFNLEVNDFCWNNAGDVLFISTERGEVEVYSFPAMDKIESFRTNGENCCTLQIDPQGKYLATGGTDALITVLSLPEMICFRTFSRPEQPIRALSFNYTSELLASSSEESCVEICSIDEGTVMHRLSTRGFTNALSWHPKKNVLAYAPGEELDDSGLKDRSPVKLFSFQY